MALDRDNRGRGPLPRFRDEPWKRPAQDPRAPDKIAAVVISTTGAAIAWIAVMAVA